MGVAKSDFLRCVWADQIWLRMWISLDSSDFEKEHNHIELNRHIHVRKVSWCVVCVARYATNGTNGWPSNGCSNDASEANGSYTTSSITGKIVCFWTDNSNKSFLYHWLVTIRTVVYHVKWFSWIFTSWNCCSVRPQLLCRIEHFVSAS